MTTELFETYMEHTMPHMRKDTLPAHALIYNGPRVLNKMDEATQPHPQKWGESTHLPSGDEFSRTLKAYLETNPGNLVYNSKKKEIRPMNAGLNVNDLLTDTGNNELFGSVAEESQKAVYATSSEKVYEAALLAKAEFKDEPSKARRLYDQISSVWRGSDARHDHVGVKVIVYDPDARGKDKPALYRFDDRGIAEMVYLDEPVNPDQVPQYVYLARDSKGVLRHDRSNLHTETYNAVLELQYAHKRPAPICNPVENGFQSFPQMVDRLRAN